MQIQYIIYYNTKVIYNVIMRAYSTVMNEALADIGDVA